jgi:hypothetical protein
VLRAQAQLPATHGLRLYLMHTPIDQHCAQERHGGGATPILAPSSDAEKAKGRPTEATGHETSYFWVGDVAGGAGVVLGVVVVGPSVRFAVVALGPSTLSRKNR